MGPRTMNYENLRDIEQYTAQNYRQPLVFTTLLKLRLILTIDRGLIKPLVFSYSGRRHFWGLTG